MIGIMPKGFDIYSFPIGSMLMYIGITYPLIPISLSEPLADSRARKRAVVGVSAFDRPLGKRESNLNRFLSASFRLLFVKILTNPSGFAAVFPQSDKNLLDKNCAAPRMSNFFLDFSVQRRSNPDGLRSTISRKRQKKSHYRRFGSIPFTLTNRE